MRAGQGCLEEVGTRRKIQFVAVEEDAINNSPWRAQLTRLDLIDEGDQGQIRCRRLAKTNDVEAWLEDGEDAPCFGVTTRQSIRDDVGASRLVLNGKIKAKELANPLVLWNGCKALIKQEFQVVVISLDDERSAPQVSPPVADDQHQADEFTLVCGQATMARSHGTAEEHH